MRYKGFNKYKVSLALSCSWLADFVDGTLCTLLTLHTNKGEKKSH
jgi:hypothetical protein